MTPWEKLEWLKANAHAVHIDINQHRCYYETVEQDLTTRNETLFDPDEADVKAECIRRNELTTVQVYPETPVSFFCFGHYELTRAIEIAYDVVSKDLAKRSAS